MARKARRARQPAAPHAFDRTYVDAVPLLLRRADRLGLYLVGCGGTGSWLAPSLARLARSLRDANWDVHLTFVDHDTVEAKNVLRQNFCNAEIGRLKAEALAMRYAQAWGLEIGVLPHHFAASMLDQGWSRVDIVVGCVDNAAARKALAAALRQNPRSDPPRVWWLDCGNAGYGGATGQVLLGSTGDLRALAHAFPVATVCRQLPSPTLQHPELLQPLPEEQARRETACADLLLANAQTLMINQRVAAEAADYLVRLTLGGLTRFATYFDMSSGSSRSKYITPEMVAAVVDRDTDIFVMEAAK